MYAWPRELFGHVYHLTGNVCLFILLNLLNTISSTYLRLYTFILMKYVLDMYNLVYFDQILYPKVLFLLLYNGYIWRQSSNRLGFNSRREDHFGEGLDEQPSGDFS